MRRLRVAVVVWLAMLGLDFALNAALFAGLYQDAGAFLLPPAELFRRIPLGYLAFFIVALSLVELAIRLDVRGTADGLRLGSAAGAAFAGTWSLGLYSIATLSLPLALTFALFWLMLLTLAGGVAAAGLAAGSLRGLALRVVAADVVCLIAVVALQSLGLVPTMRL